MSFANIIKRVAISGISYSFDETISNGNNGSIILIPDGIELITIGLFAGTNSGGFKVSISDYSLLKKIPENANWINLEMSDNTGSIIETIISPIHAIQGFSISGEVKIEVAF